MSLKLVISTDLDGNVTIERMFSNEIQDKINTGFYGPADQIVLVDGCDSLLTLMDDSDMTDSIDLDEQDNMLIILPVVS